MHHYDLVLVNLQNLVSPLVEASEYTQSILSKLFKPLMRFCGNRLNK